MSKLPTQASREFIELVGEIPRIGLERHAQNLIRFALENLKDVQKSLREIPHLQGAKSSSGIVISAGPSIHRRKIPERILKSGYQGTIIVADGAYLACLKAGLIPDFVMTLDPHPTRTVRWFGDPNFQKHSEVDDYFTRQDLDLDFRKNSAEQNQRNIELVNRCASLTKALVASCVSHNVVERLQAAQFDLYWWNPLVDDPNQPGSLTRELYRMNRLPCLNTGGTVGTAAWVFATSILKMPRVAVVGMDFGYYSETPWKETQTYYELVDRLGNEEEVSKYFVQFEFPLTGEGFYTDPTYFWYRKNFLELLGKAAGSVTVNCTEAGTLVDERIPCVSLDEFLMGVGSNGRKGHRG